MLSEGKSKLRETPRWNAQHSKPSNMWRKTLQIQKEGKKPTIDKTVQWQDNAVAATKALNSTFRNLHKRKKFNTKSLSLSLSLSLSQKDSH
jgi:hypothetical protein